tara:strand:- start:84 stop:482 length:399 start_codon:yes stop_codon:yes gene_type:complete
MDKAQLVEYNLDITLGCPKCDYLFQLSNYSIPTEGSTYQVCENCQIPLEIKPVSIKIKYKKTPKIKKSTEKVVSDLLEYGKQDAKKIIQSYGFASKEIDNVLKNLETDGMAIETIVKEVLSRIDKKHEPATT